MKKIIALVFVITSAALSLARCEPAAPLRPDDVLTLNGGQFFLDGRPFAEISFNKFDLFWAVWDAVKSGQPGELQKAVARQNAALRDLHSMGFRTLRIFGAPWSAEKGDLAALWTDEAKQKQWLQAADAVMDLCERNGVQVVYSLGLGGFATGANGGRPSPLYTSADSPERKLCYAYLDTIVRRYKHRRAVLMWEVSNELTNMADIGVWKGRQTPSLPQIAGFFDQTARRIKEDDPLRLVSTGGSGLRGAAWHRWQRHNWELDSLDQYKEAYAAYFAHSHIDVIDSHFYELRAGGVSLATSGGKALKMNPADYVGIARALGKGAIIGEYGTLPTGWSDGEKKPSDAAWFVGYNDPKAREWVQKGLDQLIAAKAPITYWWAYQSDRAVDQKTNPVTFSLETTPELVRLIAEANRRLQASVQAR